MTKVVQRNKAFSEWLRQVSAAPSETFAAELVPGQQIGPFQIVKRIGQGGFGIVYEALEQPINRRVALKIQRRKAVAQEAAAFVREAQLVAALQHPRIVTLYRYGEYTGRAYLVFELLRGATLQSTIDRAALDTREALAIAIAVAEGMCYAHANGVLHRDLKPSNVFICESQARDGASIKLLDFGLSRETRPEQELACGGSGTRGFTAPEGATSNRSDIYSAGMTLYASLIPNAEQRMGAPDIVAEALRDRGAHSSVRELILAAIAANPEHRPAAAEEWLKRLCAARDQVLEEMRPKPRLGRAPRILSASALLLAVGVAGAVTYSKQPRETADGRELRPAQPVQSSSMPAPQASVIVQALEPKPEPEPHDAPPSKPSAATALKRPVQQSKSHTVWIAESDQVVIEPAPPPAVAASSVREHH